ncbi:PQQ-dependent sugar dehydrogenase [Coraliomargarita sinensis]|nr:PQQ-dependent sugar dehydrogenase [Coraliomargarita sinensis]
MLILLGLIVGCSLWLRKPAWETDGSVAVTDHRELPNRKAATTVIVSGLDAPWGFDWLPNGDILLSERFGSLRIIRDGELDPQPIGGIPEIYISGQGGLLDVIVHPRFDENQLIYLSYSAGSDAANRLQVLRAELRDGELANAEVIFKVVNPKSGGQHFGSRFAWLPDETLLFSVGDGGNPPAEYGNALIREQAQSLDEHFGKILRIHDDGAIPSDNPYVDAPGVLPEIWSLGHRNVQGLTYDSIHQRVLASEHGSQGGDELNAIHSGANYGWPRTTYAREYDLTSTLITPHQALPDFREPEVVWTPSIAPSGLVAYTGSRYENAVGDVFLAAMLLRANKTILAYIPSPAGAILRLKADETGGFPAQEKIRIGAVRVRDIGQGPDGFLYVLTDTTDFPAEPGMQAGTLLRINRL